MHLPVFTRPRLRDAHAFSRWGGVAAIAAGVAIFLCAAVARGQSVEPVEVEPRKVVDAVEETPPAPQSENPESNPEDDWTGDLGVRKLDSPPDIPESAPLVIDEKTPSLDTLTAAIPESNRELLEELFRGRFVRVKKFDPSELR